MIQLRHVHFAYPASPPVFAGLDWHLARGEQWAVIGASGCGKSTLLMLMAGLCSPQAGQVLVNGKPLSCPTPRTGLVFQDYELLPWATLRQNVELGLRIRRFYGRRWHHAPNSGRAPDSRAAADAWLAQLGILDVAERRPAQVSGGQRQRAAIARALVIQAECLLMDEPFSALDAATRETLQDLTTSLCRENGVSLALVTHSIEEAASVGQHILLLRPTRPATWEVIENPHEPGPDFRATAAFQACCRELREALQ